MTYARSFGGEGASVRGGNKINQSVKSRSVEFSASSQRRSAWRIIRRGRKASRRRDRGRFTPARVF